MSDKPGCSSDPGPETQAPDTPDRPLRATPQPGLAPFKTSAQGPVTANADLPVHKMNVGQEVLRFSELQLGDIFVTQNPGDPSDWGAVSKADMRVIVKRLDKEIAELRTALQEQERKHQENIREQERKHQENIRAAVAEAFQRFVQDQQQQIIAAFTAGRPAGSKE